MLKAVTFDLWNTLITNRDYTSYRVDHLSGVLEEQGSPRSRDEIRDAYVSARAHARRIEESNEHRYVKTEEKLDHVLLRLRVELPRGVKSTMVSLFQEAIWEDPPTLKAGVCETLEALEPRYGMAIISDSGITPGWAVREMLDDSGILDHFASTMFSDEVGFCKPHGAMFEKALGELGARPRDAIHVGDLLRTDVAGAKAMGMKAVWVNTGETAGGHPLQPDYEISELPQLLLVLDEIRGR